MQALELAQITLDYGRRRVLYDLSLQVTTGGVVVVTGSNGSGKSTLLRVIAGLQRPTAGVVWCVADGAALSPVTDAPYHWLDGA
jgi:ABC-type sugar transport system ATPase subunit